MGKITNLTIKLLEETAYHRGKVEGLQEALQDLRGENTFLRGLMGYSLRGGPKRCPPDAERETRLGQRVRRLTPGIRLTFGVRHGTGEAGSFRGGFASWLAASRPKSSRTRRVQAAGRPAVEDFLETLDTDEEDLDSSTKTTSDTTWSPNRRAPMGRGGVLASGGGDVVTPGGAVAHVAQQPRRSRFPLSAPGPPSFPTTDDVGCLMSRETSWTSWTSDQHLDATARASSPGPGANNLAPPAGDCSDPAAPLPPRVDIQDSAKQVADELRTLVSRAPPRSFQGPRLWDVARQALLGVDICSQELINENTALRATLAAYKKERERAPSPASESVAALQRTFSQVLQQSPATSSRSPAGQQQEGAPPVAPLPTMPPPPAAPRESLLVYPASKPAAGVEPQLLAAGSYYSGQQPL
ncbi:hypothetical protein HPB47_017178 [Ixodes persulcatus]|uniref:Uncharacterized protein n=1 Tax=Ixodes persulcatus TaxID=34615 RepID=A0AC60R025_IXOPE|nr:hypothetical protein HPB47_017178 [Ixodes persulcatus]